MQEDVGGQQGLGHRHVCKGRGARKRSCVEHGAIMDCVTFEQHQLVHDPPCCSVE